MSGDFIKGLVLGFSIAAPVGPIGLLCIRRTLSSGFGAGVAGGLGTAAADALYAAVAAFGITAVAAAISTAATALQAGGIAVLAWLGARTFFRPPASGAITGSHAGVFAQTFFLTMTNPTTILSFAAVFTGIGLVNGSNAGRAAVLVAGTFAGSMAWWIILSGVVSRLRERLTPRVLVWINRGAGLALLAFAAVLAARLIRR